MADFPLIVFFQSLWDLLVLETFGRAKPRACPSCESQDLFETGQGYTRTEAVGLEGADIMVHYREYRCTDCGDLCHFRAD